MKEFMTIKQMQNDEELQSMGRYQWQSDIRDNILEMLEDEGIKFVDVCEEY